MVEEATRRSLDNDDSADDDDDDDDDGGGLHGGGMIAKAVITFACTALLLGVGGAACAVVPVRATAHFGPSRFLVATS